VGDDAYTAEEIPMSRKSTAQSRIATVVQVAERLAVEHGWHEPTRATGRCGFATYALQRALPHLGSAHVHLDPERMWTTPCGPVRCLEHNAAIIDGQVIDPTARQFDPELPTVFVTDVETWERQAGGWLLLPGDERPALVVTERLDRAGRIRAGGVIAFRDGHDPLTITPQSARRMTEAERRELGLPM
jgi:hypothetical protein